MARVPSTASTMGYIYFVRAGRTYNVKIGWATDPYKRIDGMQSSSPHPLYLIGYFPGDRFEEFRWHRRWKELHVRGEWFRLEDELRSAINSKMTEPESCCYIHIASDWRAIRRKHSQFKRGKAIPFLDAPNESGTKSGTNFPVQSENG